MDSHKQPFNKPPSGIDEHISLLKSRGLQFLDEVSACDSLKFIGYYKLRGYFIPFQVHGDAEHAFLQGTTFEKILEHYTFDSELRLLTLKALEQIESALKAVLSDVMCLKFGSTWYIEEKFFSYSDRFAHLDYLISVREDLQTHKKTQFLTHYYNKYNEPEFPPSWMIFQILSFGASSKLFKNLKTDYQKGTAQPFGFDHVLLASWFESLTVTRNICAHHSRLYNLTFSRSPKIADEHKHFVIKSGKFYAQAIIIFALLKKINPSNTWNLELKQLLRTHSTIPLDWLGFPDNWETEKFWG